MDAGVSVLEKKLNKFKRNESILIEISRTSATLYKFIYNERNFDIPNTVITQFFHRIRVIGKCVNGDVNGIFLKSD